jgi:hypothetical protein
MAKKSESRNVNKEHKVHSSKQARAQKPGREERLDNGKGQRQNIQEKEMTRGNKGMDDRIKGMAGGNKSKSGCFPKLFMLLLPFVAVGAYLSLRS